MGDTGLEHGAESLGIPQFGVERSISVATGDSEAAISAWLDACPVDLADVVKADILAIVQAAAIDS